MSDMKQARADLLQMIKNDPDMRYGEQLKIKLKGINTERKI